MTIKDAIDFINNKVQIDVRYCTNEDIDKTREAFNLAISALEKRISQKLIHINGYKCCPVCKEEICSIGDDGCYGFFCVNKDCGQALDWEK